MSQTISIPMSYPLIRAVEQGEISCKQFEARVLRLSRKIDRIEKGTVTAQRNLLRSMSRDITTSIASVADVETLARGDIEAAIDAAVDRFAVERRRIAQGAVQDAVDAAQDFRQGIARIAGQGAAAAPVQSGIAADIFEVQGVAAEAFAQDLRSRIKREILDGVVKGNTPKQIAAEIVSKRIMTPNRAAGDPSARGALGQVERLARTEIRQVFNAAAFSSGRADQKNVKGILKTWITQMDAQVRESHIAAGRRYAIGGNPGPIPLHQKFLVGEARLQFPNDPSGPPEESINCRCLSAQLIPDVAEKIECP